MRVALTGTSGFLGRRVAARARQRGWEVRGLTRTPGRAAPDGVQLVVGDLSMPSVAADLMRGADVFIHLASLGVQSRDREWGASIETNVEHLIPWLQASQEAGVARQVVAGTCLEYRGHGVLPDAPWDGPAPRCREDDSLEAGSIYGATKAAGGLLARAWARTAGADLRYLRLSSLYGPDDDAEKFLPSLIRASCRGETFAMSAGAQVREWLWVDDAAEAVLLAAEGGAPATQTINVGTGEGVSLIELASRVFRLAGQDRALIRAGTVAYRPGEVHHLVMDSARAHADLGWSPRVALDDGLRALLAAQRDGAPT